MKIKKVMTPKSVGVISFVAVCLFGVVLIRAGAVSAQARAPLLIPGKRTLYQKVITHRGAKLFAIDGDILRVVEGWINPFSVYYVRNLGELGILAEFLDDLPYRSSIMRLTEEDWYRLSLGEQQAFINDWKSKIKRYAQIHDDVATWKSFGAKEPGDAVFRVSLSLMP